MYGCACVKYSLYVSVQVPAQSAQLPAQPVQAQYQSVPPPSTMDPTALPLHTLALQDPTLTHQAPPLPAKLDHNVATDPGPMSLPPPSATPAFHTMPTIQHPQSMPSVYPDPTQPPGSHGDPSLWVNSHTPSLHPPTHLNPSPTSTPPQQHSPMVIAQPLSNPGAGSVSVPYQPQQAMVTAAAPQQAFQSLPQQQVCCVVCVCVCVCMCDHVPIYVYFTTALSTDYKLWCNGSSATSADHDPVAGATAAACNS